MSCTIPEEALRSFVRTIMPDIIAFFESEEGGVNMKNGLRPKKDKRLQAKLNNNKSRLKYDRIRFQPRFLFWEQPTHLLLYKTS